MYETKHEEEKQKHHLKKVVAFSATSVIALAALAAVTGAAIARASCRGK